MSASTPKQKWGERFTGKLFRSRSKQETDDASTLPTNDQIRMGCQPFDTAQADEQPPAYTDVVEGNSRLGAGRSTREALSASSVANTTTSEDPYAFLSKFDTIFLIDDSGSMTLSDRWRETKEALRSITPICAAHDSDGIDVYFLNNKSNQPADAKSGRPANGYRGIKNAAAVDRLFSSVRPRGGTMTGTRLHHILDPYLDLLEQNPHEMKKEKIKPVNIIVITDGAASDDVEGTLLGAAMRLDAIKAPAYQVGVQFFQVGNDRDAREALEGLDDGLSGLVKGGTRDIVDTVTWSETRGGSYTLSGEAILKVVLGAVIRRLDRRNVTNERRG
ncbi:uncharacterized protein DNG_08385 [Cephalotrichum gorgonifer]|uniref:VWFA domain-containing protein n=1 Tax=Cephalotrichum gorgonifer TaxID=2041049 RepID=A0AAE8SYF7_9PEZI|nr:uncharacterized protein DNG_08385 [Cephalotrichum gorgonifer]